jgi:hypothetical protein
LKKARGFMNSRYAFDRVIVMSRVFDESFEAGGVVWGGDGKYSMFVAEV